jgi:transcriptional regulator with XRE-family HTH domain
MSENEYARIIAKNLRRIAAEANVTQAEMSRTLKIDKSTLSSWMNGTRTPKMRNIDMLAHYFNVSRADIMEERRNEKFTPTEEEVELILTYRKADEIDKAMVRRILNIRERKKDNSLQEEDA